MTDPVPMAAEQRIAWKMQAMLDIRSICRSQLGVSDVAGLVHVTVSGRHVHV